MNYCRIFGITASNSGKTGNRSPYRAYFEGTPKRGRSRRKNLPMRCLAKSLSSDIVPCRNKVNSQGLPLRIFVSYLFDCFHQAPSDVSTVEEIKFVKHLSNILIRILFLVQLMYNLVSFVTRGSVRRKVLKGLLRPTTTTELAKMIGVAPGRCEPVPSTRWRKSGSWNVLRRMKTGIGITGSAETGKKVAEIIEGKGK